MGVSYETDSQSNIAWMKDRLAALERRLDNADGAQRVAAGRGGPVTGAPLVVTPHSANGTQLLARRAGAVFLSFRVTAGAAISADGVVLTLPAGFRPPANAPDLLLDGLRYTSSAWGFQGYVIRNDGTVRLLQTAAASGDVCAALVPPFLAGA